MSIAGAVGAGIVSNAIYDALRLAAASLIGSAGRQKSHAVLVSAVRQYCGVDINADEAQRLLALVESYQPEDLLSESVEADDQEVLAQTIDRDVLLTASPEFARRHGDPSAAAAQNFERATAMARGIWPSVLSCLSYEQQRQLRADVAAIQGAELAKSILHELQVVSSSTEKLETLAPRLTPGLPVERAMLRPPAAIALSPYEMLWARYGQVEFIDRGNWLNQLQAWCDETSPFECQIIYGAGGSGKTRLGLEFCRRMSSRGWIAGLINNATTAELTSLAIETRPKLVVIDYADTRPDLVRRVVEALSTTRPLRAHRVRIVLLVRRLGRQGDPRRWFITGHQNRSATYLANSKTLNLSQKGRAVAFGLTERRALFSRALSAFTGTTAETTTSQRWREVLGSDNFSTPLLVLVAALLATHSESVPSETTIGDLLDQVLDREDETHWIGSPETSPQLRRRAVAIASLFLAHSEEDALDLLEIEPALGQEADRTRLAFWLHTLYEGPHWLNSLEPDLLAERLVHSEIRGAWIDHAVENVHTTRGRRALAVLGRIGASEGPNQSFLGDALAAHIGTLIETAFAEADDEPPQDSDVLADLLIPLLQLDAVDRAARLAIPDRVGVDAKRLAVELKRLAVEQRRRTCKSVRTDTNVARLASSLDNYSIRLSEAGDFEESLGPAEEAIELYVDLASSAFAEHGPALARTLSNLSGRRAENGDLVGAANASGRGVDICRELVSDHGAAHIPALAAALNNHAIDLAEIDQDEQGLQVARETVELYRSLSESDAGYLRDLAMSSHNLSIDLGNAGLHEESVRRARDAAEIFDDLHDAQPLVYRHDLGAAFHNLALQCLEIDELAHGLKAAEQAVSIRRDLALADTQHSEGLVRSLNLLADIYDRLDLPNESAKARRLSQSDQYGYP